MFTPNSLKRPLEGSREHKDGAMARLPGLCLQLTVPSIFLASILLLTSASGVQVGVEGSLICFTAWKTIPSFSSNF